MDRSANGPAKADSTSSTYTRGNVRFSIGYRWTGTCVLMLIHDLNIHIITETPANSSET